MNGGKESPLDGFAHLLTTLSPEGGASADACTAHPILPGGALVPSEAQVLRSFHIPLGAERVAQLSVSDPLFSCGLLRDLPMTRTELHNPVTGPQGTHLHPSIGRYHVLCSLTFRG